MIDLYIAKSDNDRILVTFTKQGRKRYPLFIINFQISKLGTKLSCYYFINFESCMQRKADLLWERDLILEMFFSFICNKAQTRNPNCFCLAPRINLPLADLNPGRSVFRITVWKIRQLGGTTPESPVTLYNDKLQKNFTVIQLNRAYRFPTR